METSLVKQVWEKIPHFLVLLSLIAFSGIKNTYNTQIAIMFLLGILLIFFLLEYLRLELNINIPIFSIFLRQKEHNQFYGVVYFLIATIICLAAFDFNIALAAILMTVFGDIAAAFIGKRYGKTLIFRNKTAQGAFAMFLTSLIVGFILLSNLYIIIAMALSATIVETMVDELEDNLWVPLIAGFIGQLILLL
jgi:phytol kinase